MRSVYQKKGAGAVRRLLIGLLVLPVLAGLIFFPSCASKVPKLEEIYDRVVELVERSYELNVIFYGEGLPYYDRDLPIYKPFYNDYSTESFTKDYHIVSSHAKYRSVDAIKMAAEQVYSPELLEQVVYPSAFTGLMVSGVGGAQFANARYLEDGENLYIYAGEDQTDFPTPLVYDYATMKIIQPSNAERVLLSVTAWEEDRPDEPITMRISVVLSDGQWLLDKLTV